MSVLDMIMTRPARHRAADGDGAVARPAARHRARLGHGGVGGPLAHRVLSVVVLLFYSMPGFWVGLMAVVLFSVKLGWLPSDSNMTIGANYTGWAMIADRAAHLILPALALASFFVAVYARPGARLDAGGAAPGFHAHRRGQGPAPFIIQLRHALRNALIPVTTVGRHASRQPAGRRGGDRDAVRLAGHGPAGARAVLARDFSVLLGVLLLSRCFLVILANMVIDLLHAWLDPRVTT